MDRIKLFDKTFKPYLSCEEIEKAIDDVAEKITNDYGNSEQPPVILCILNGSVMFTAELMKRLNFPLEFVSMKVSSYVGTKSTGRVLTALGMTGDVKGKDVIIVEDIIDSGNTIEALDGIVRQSGARDIKVCTMLFKPGAYNKDIKIDYIGKNIPDDFIVGFGLDYNGLGRNLNDIYVLDED